MNLCKDCKYFTTSVQVGSRQEAADEPLCSNPAYVDPVLGTEMTCRQVRNAAAQCGPDGAGWVQA